MIKRMDNERDSLGAFHMRIATFDAGWVNATAEQEAPLQRMVESTPKAGKIALVQEINPKGWCAVRTLHIPHIQSVDPAPAQGKRLVHSSEWSSERDSLGPFRLRIATFDSGWVNASAEHYSWALIARVWLSIGKKAGARKKAGGFLSRSLSSRLIAVRTLHIAIAVIIHSFDRTGLVINREKGWCKEKGWGISIALLIQSLMIAVRTLHIAIAVIIHSFDRLIGRYQRAGDGLTPPW